MANGWYNKEHLFDGNISEDELLLLTNEEMEEIANAPSIEEPNEIQNEEGC